MSHPSARTVSRAEPLETIGPRGRVGLVTLATDLCVESDLRTMLPDIRRAAADIVPDVPLDVLIYGCTSGTVAIGEAQIFRLLREARGPFPCTTPVTAALAAIRTLKARRLVILTPYLTSVNSAMARFFVSEGLEVVVIGGFGLASDADYDPSVPGIHLSRSTGSVDS